MWSLVGDFNACSLQDGLPDERTQQFGIEQISNRRSLNSACGTFRFKVIKLRSQRISKPWFGLGDTPRCTNFGYRRCVHSINVCNLQLGASLESAKRSCHSFTSTLLVSVAAAKSRALEPSCTSLPGSSSLVLERMRMYVPWLRKKGGCFLGSTLGSKKHDQIL